MKNKKGLMLAIIGIFGLLIITISLTYGFFSYVKQGSKENVLSTGTITFLYTEVDKIGNGISISNSYPISDNQGKMLSAVNDVFDFKITSNTSSDFTIPYEITARKKSNSTLDEKAVKLYLTKVSGYSEEELLLKNYSDLPQTDRVTVDKYVEKTIYEGKIPANSVNYEQSFKLRMWIADNIDFSPIKDDGGNIIYPYNDKKFTININVYSDAKVVTEDEIALENSTKILNILADNTEFTKVENDNYQYELDVVDSSFIDISVETENPNSIITIERLDNLVYSNSNIKRLSLSKKFELIPGENYFKVTITSENNINSVSHILKVNFISDILTLEAESILDALDNDNLKTGYYTFVVNGENYSVHLYNLNGNQIFSNDQIFGTSNDVATIDSYAKRMVIVKVNGDVTVNEGVTVGPYYDELYGGPKGFTLYVTGTLTNNGIIDNSHGAYAEGQNVYLWKNADGSYEYVPAIGALGGASIVNTSSGAIGNNGDDAKGRATGGGASGSSGGTDPLKSGAGAAGTSYSGGSGGGGIYCVNGTCKQEGHDAFANGGAGGAGVVSAGDYTAYASGGAGNAAGKSAYSGSRADGNVENKMAENGTGGLLIIYANNFYNNGIVSANGSDVNSVRHQSESRLASGGASGAGSVNIFFKNASKKGTVTAIGGISSLDSTGITHATRGGNGGNGSINIGKIVNGTYDDGNIRANSILSALNDNDLQSGYHNIKVLDQLYPVHLYVLDGDQHFIGDTSFGDSNDVSDGVEYAKNMVIVKVKGNVIIDSDAIVRPYYDELYGGPKGFVFYATGTITNNGTIDNSHGAYAEGENVYLWKNTDGTYEYIPAEGAAGGISQTVKSDGNIGNSGVNRQTGGGGGGAASGTKPKASGAGSAGTSYSGGTGGSGIYCVSSTCTQAGNPGLANGGAGGAGVVSGSGYESFASGGVGNASGKNAYSYGKANGNIDNTMSENGTGGLLVIYAKKFINNNVLTANGSNINAVKHAKTTRYAGGGASGGGSINVFANEIENNGTESVLGGESKLNTTGISYFNLGGAGGAGTVTYTQISFK